MEFVLRTDNLGLGWHRKVKEKRKQTGLATIAVQAQDSIENKDVL